MKFLHILPVLSLLFLFASCDRDIPPFNLDTWDVRWYDDDNNGKQSLGDALTFDILATATDDDPDDQYVEEWEFAYWINGDFGGVLLGNDNENGNSVDVNAEVKIKNLVTPGAGALEKGDVVEFRFWAKDNHGSEVEQKHRFVLED